MVTALFFVFLFSVFLSFLLFFHLLFETQRLTCTQKVFLSRNVISQAGPEVSSLGKDVISDQVFAWVTDAERNKPYIKGSGRDALGRWTGELVTGEGWRNLKDFATAKG